MENQKPYHPIQERFLSHRATVADLQLQTTQMQRDHQEAMEDLQNQIKRLERKLLEHLKKAGIE